MKKTNIEFPFLAVMLAAIALTFDQVIKWWVLNYLKPEPIIYYDWLKLVYVENTGIAFGIQIPESILVYLNLVFLALVIAFLIVKLDLKKAASQVILGALMGGALGNIFDRFAHGFVIDYVSVGSFPVFNLADALITVSLFLVVILYGKIIKHNQNKNAGLPS